MPSEDFKSIKKIQWETKDTLIEIKNNLQGNNSRVEDIKNQINDLKHKEERSIQSEEQEEKNFKNEDGLRSLWDNFKCTNICIMGCWKEKRESKTLETYMEK